MKKEVHDTAFMIAYYRAQHETISKDPFAKLWLDGNNLAPWAKDFETHVSEHDELLHCLRNRYFYERLHTLVEDNPETLFINIGAGFSMYPYSLPEQVHSIEVELPQIAAYKKERVEKFVSENKLPSRKVQHLAYNIIDKSSHPELLSVLNANRKGRTIILIEGVFFFLNKAEIETVLQLCAKIQQPGDHLFCVSFADAVSETPVFNRLKAYFTEVLDSHQNPFTVVPHSFYETIEGYTLDTYSSTLALGKELNCFPHDFQEATVLNEHCYQLIRQA